MTIRQRLHEIAMERGLRPSTVYSYLTLLGRLDILDLDDIETDDLYARIWTIENPNVRRAAVIACRSVLGVKIKIPKGVPRHYTLPDEDTLRIALMTSPHEIRGLLMMYAGLRIGEACAVTESDVHGDKLDVTRQVMELSGKGYRICRVAPVKTNEGSITIPYWLSERLVSVDDTPKPGSVRESLRRAGWKVGINLNPHMLRHWYATTLLARGVPLKLVSEQMRHSDVATTLRSYQQTDQGDIHRALGDGR